MRKNPRNQLRKQYSDFDETHEKKFTRRDRKGVEGKKQLSDEVFGALGNELRRKKMIKDTGAGRIFNASGGGRGRVESVCRVGEPPRGK